jgi:hypothetical protein
MTEIWGWDSKRRYNAGLVTHLRLGWDIPRKQLEAETVVYLALPNANLDAQTVNNYIRTIKAGGTVSFLTQTLNISNPATSPLFITNPLTDLRWAKGFYITLTDAASKTMKVLVGDAGTGETYEEKISNGGFDSNTTGWGGTRCSLASVAGGQSGNCLELTNTSSGGMYATQAITTSGGLYLPSVYVKDGTATGKTVEFWYSDIQVGAVATNSGWQQIGGGYKTLNKGAASIYCVVPGAAVGETSLQDTFSLLQVLTPSATGVSFSSPTVASGFDYNAASYTVAVTLN